MKRWHARGEQRDLRPSETFLFREVLCAVRDDQAEIARARGVDARVIDLVQNSVADGEPHAAVAAERRAHTARCARRPPRLDARPSWRMRQRGGWRSFHPRATIALGSIDARAVVDVGGSHIKAL